MTTWKELNVDTNVKVHSDCLWRPVQGARKVLSGTEKKERENLLHLSTQCFIIE